MPSLMPKSQPLYDTESVPPGTAASEVALSTKPDIRAVQIARRWPARLHLEFAHRGGRSCVTRARHHGPLRIQRPFYPEGDLAHVYLLHPPGGLVVGDELQIDLCANKGSRTLVTTPSAGKVYSLLGLKHSDQTTAQCQRVDLSLDDDSLLEWLPQETIVFDGANARLTTRVEAHGSARFCLWDIVCLGRPASGERFSQGQVWQTLEVTIDGQPRLIERNRIAGGDAMMSAPWGLQGCGSFGTLVASVEQSRDAVDDLLQMLAERYPGGSPQWGITQKQGLFIARYLGQSAAQCRQGFSDIWSRIRPALCAREAVWPRIWNT